MFCLFVVDCCNDSDTPHSYRNVREWHRRIFSMPTIYNFVWGIGYILMVAMSTKWRDSGKGWFRGMIGYYLEWFGVTLN